MSFKINIENLIDFRNKELWQTLNSKYDISIAENKDDTYGCFTQGNTVIIYIGKNNLCKDSFTHELLHIYLKSKSILLGNSLKLLFRENKSLSSIFNEDLMEHVGNCLDHKKILPIYLEMGFEKEKFLSDYYTPKCTSTEIQLIKQSFIPNTFLFSASLNIYFGKYFGIKADPNENIEYSHFLISLENINLELFQILERFWEQWISFDIEKPDDIFHSYHSLVYDFYLELESWVLKMLN